MVDVGGPSGIEEASVPNYERFVNGDILTYEARRDTFPGTLDVRLEIQHISRPAGTDAPYEFTAKFTAYTGDYNRVSWISRRTDSQMHRISRQDGFGDFFNYLEGGVEHVHALLRKEPSIHDLRACFFDIEAKMVGDFCIPGSTPKTLSDEVKRKLF